MEIILELLLVLWEIPLRILGELVAKISFIAIGYFFGFFLVLFFTLGSIEPGPISGCADGGGFHRSKGMKFWHITYYENGKRYLPAETVALTGWGLIALIIAFSCLIARYVG